MKNDRRAVWIWIAIALLAALAAVFAIQMWGRAVRANGNDLTTYLVAARDFWRGANPYAADAPFPFIYPLFLCVAVWPLLQVPYGLAVSVWYGMSIGALAVATRAVAIMRGATRMSWFVVAAVVAVVLADVIQNNLVNGQVNAVVLALCMLGALAWARERRLGAGIAIGAAIAIKITPALLLVWLARRRDWRTLAWTAVAAIVLAIGLPWLVAGARVWSDYAYYGHTFLADRLAEPADVVTHYRAFGLVEVARQLTGSPLVADTWIVAVLVTAALWITDRPAARPPVHAFARYLAASLLINPMSEVHHLILLWPALLLLVQDAAEGRLSLTRRIILALVLIAALTLREVPFGAFAAVLGTCALI